MIQRAYREKTFCPDPLSSLCSIYAIPMLNAAGRDRLTHLSLCDPAIAGRLTKGRRQRAYTRRTDQKVRGRTFIMD